MGTYTLSTSSGLPNFFLSEYLSSRYGIILQTQIFRRVLSACNRQHLFGTKRQVRTCRADMYVRKAAKCDALLVTVIQPFPALQLCAKGDLLLWRDFLDPADQLHRALSRMSCLSILEVHSRIESDAGPHLCHWCTDAQTHMSHDDILCRA